jgi:rhodanese-related sulfurtransferase
MGMSAAAGSDSGRPIVFMCLSSECWISYNASLHAIEGGYKDVIWYRGGAEVWKAAGLELKAPTPVGW